MSKRHDQKPDKKNMTCTPCGRGHCEECVDIIRMLFTKNRICQCTRKGHDGEPINQQIKDPETGTVYAPGLTVTEDGTVNFNESPSDRIKKLG